MPVASDWKVVTGTQVSLLWHVLGQVCREAGD
jgi:hypothetical protein